MRIAAHHGVCLATGCDPVGKHGATDTHEGWSDEGACNRGVHVQVGGLWVGASGRDGGLLSCDCERNKEACCLVIVRGIRRPVVL